MQSDTERIALGLRRGDIAVLEALVEQYQYRLVRYLVYLLGHREGLAGPSGKGSPFTWHVKGNLFLTGDDWTRIPQMDDRGHPSGWGWRYDFNEGREFGGDELWFYTNKRALCVRGSQD